MKDLTNIYINLSKCTEEQQRVIRMTLYKNREYVPFFTNLFEIDRYYKLHCDKGDWLCGDVMFNEKTEILFSEFIKLFEGGEGNNGWIKIESEADLPKEDIPCYFILKSNKAMLAGKFSHGCFDYISRYYDHNDVTHYQPIIKPEPPKF